MGAANNPTPHKLPDGENAKPLEVVGSTATDSLIIVMVGLPATGKTHIARRICRFLNFFHNIPARIFNVGDYRRQLVGAKQPASFYDPENKEALALRTAACNSALQDLTNYMEQDGVRVGLYDATNSTKDRRKHLKTSVKNIGAKIMFIESICMNATILEENIRTVKLGTPDYEGVDPEEAVADFKARRENYNKYYEPLEDHEGSYIKMYDCKKFVVNNVRGYLPSKVIHFCMNLHTLPRTFYLSRHGQSEYNVLGKIGGDSSLSANGVEYARRLAKFAEETIAFKVENNDDGTEEKTEVPCRLWTSTLKRTKETAQFIQHPSKSFKWDNDEEIEWCQFRPMARQNLDEIYAGTCDGMTYKEIQQYLPKEFAARQKDKLAYRYPRGESYMDVILRLEPLAHELERTREPVLIVGHQGIHRIIYAYFMGLKREEAPYVSIPLNTVIKLSPHAYGCVEERICLMDKKEMLFDGQDEPVTSMPVPSDLNTLDPPSH